MRHGRWLEVTGEGRERGRGAVGWRRTRGREGVIVRWEAAGGKRKGGVGRERSGESRKRETERWVKKIK